MAPVSALASGETGSESDIPARPYINGKGGEVFEDGRHRFIYPASLVGGRREMNL